MRWALIALLGACNAIDGADGYSVADGAAVTDASCDASCLTTSFACIDSCTATHTTCVAGCANTGCTKKCDDDMTSLTARRPARARASRAARGARRRSARPCPPTLAPTESHAADAGVAVGRALGALVRVRALDAGVDALLIAAIGCGCLAVGVRDADHALTLIGVAKGCCRGAVTVLQARDAGAHHRVAERRRAAALRVARATLPAREALRAANGLRRAAIGVREALHARVVAEKTARRGGPTIAVREAVDALIRRRVADGMGRAHAVLAGRALDACAVRRVADRQRRLPLLTARVRCTCGMALMIGPARGHRAAAVRAGRARRALSLDAARIARRAVRILQALDAAERAAADRVVSSARARSVDAADGAPYPRTPTRATTRDDERHRGSRPQEKRLDLEHVRHGASLVPRPNARNTSRSGRFADHRAGHSGGHPDLMSNEVHVANHRVHVL